MKNNIINDHKQQKHRNKKPPTTKSSPKALSYHIFVMMLSYMELLFASGGAFGLEVVGFCKSFWYLHNRKNMTKKIPIKL